MREIKLCLLLPLVFGHLSADDWPRWLGPNGQSVYHESGVLTSIPDSGLKQLWEIEVGLGYSGPAVVDGWIYVMDYVIQEGEVTNNAGGRDQLIGTERVLCVSAETGELKWKYEYDCPYEISYAGGPRCTPTVADGKVYALGAEGHLNCLDADSGELIWSKNFKKDYEAETPFWGHSAHPFVHEKLVYCIVGGEGCVVVAFDKDTGKEVWRALSAKTQGYCSPSLIDFGGVEQLIVWHPESVNGLNPYTGEAYWSEDLKPDYGGSIQVPQKRGPLLFVGGPRVASLFKLSVQNGVPGIELVWEANPRTGVYPVNSNIFFSEDAIYAVDCNSSALTAVNPANGARFWQTKQPVLRDLVTRTRQGSAYLVRIRDTSTFFIFNETGDLITAELTPHGYEERGRYPVLDPTTKTNAAGPRMVVWSHPAFSEHTVYARNDKKLVAVDLSAGNYSQ